MTLLNKKAQRRNSAFELLEGVAREVVMGRIDDEDAAAGMCVGFFGLGYKGRKGSTYYSPDNLFTFVFMSQC